MPSLPPISIVIIDDFKSVSLVKAEVLVCSGLIIIQCYKHGLVGVLLLVMWGFFRLHDLQGPRVMTRLIRDSIETSIFRHRFMLLFCSPRALYTAHRTENKWSSSTEEQSQSVNRLLKFKYRSLVAFIVSPKPCSYES